MESWSSPLPPGVLPEAGEVHVWRLALDWPGPEIDRWRRWLSGDERGRADRFVRAEDRVRFAAGRGQLRAVLGRYLGREPGAVAFRYGPHGKPELDEIGPLRFNLSHSHALALLAVALDCRIGADIEWMRPMREWEGIVGRFFSARERAEFFALPEGPRMAAFYNGWTRKEAYLKALGSGLAAPLDRFSVNLTPGEPARLVEIAGREEEAARWALHDLEPAPGYRGAVLVEGPAWQFRHFDPGA